MIKNIQLPSNVLVRDLNYGVKLRWHNAPG